MKNGIYRYEDRDSYTNRGEFVIRVKETEKSYCFELIKNDMRFSPAHLDMMFKESNKAKVNKEKSPHAMNIGEDYFVIYPYRAGKPFLFILCKEEKAVNDEVDKEKNFEILKHDLPALDKYNGDGVLSCTEKIIIERNKLFDSIIFGEIREIAVENGIETRVCLHDKAIVNALKKQIPQKVELYTHQGNFVSQNYPCPSCGEMLGLNVNKKWTKFCPNCGQALDWSD